MQVTHSFYHLVGSRDLDASMEDKNSSSPVMVNDASFLGLSPSLCSMSIFMQLCLMKVKCYENRKVAAYILDWQIPFAPRVK